MAESMKGLKRTHRCGELSAANAGEKVTVMGWVQKQRNKGGIIFVDLRDRAGILQVIFEEADCGQENFAKAEKLRSEFVVAIVGKVEKRAGAVNENLATGEIEVRAESLRVLSEAETPPFPIETDSRTKEELRLKYRYLDLRRPDLQRNLMLRSRMTAAVHAFLKEEGFLEVETPILNKSTPEGARDYLVPSRIHQGCFYALPQSPQIFKQLLMCSGYDRYFQIARCFRDEDLRADRQPEFTQIDMEMSFVDMEDVIDVTERMVARVCREAVGLEVPLPMKRMTWEEAMNRFGSDKPDTRFGMELVDVSETVAGCGFGVFTGALESGGSVRGINAKGQAEMPRKKIDALVEFAKGYGVKGLAYLAVLPDGSYKSSFAKFMTEEELAGLAERLQGLGGDIRIIMEHTGMYWRPIAHSLKEAEFFVSVVNAILIHNFSDNSLRKVKTDKADALKSANYGLTFWTELRNFSDEDETRQMLKMQCRLYERTQKISVELRNGLISLLDQTFPRINEILPAHYCTKRGHYKWVDVSKRF